MNLYLRIYHLYQCILVILLSRTLSCKGSLVFSLEDLRFKSPFLAYNNNNNNNNSETKQNKTYYKNKKKIKKIKKSIAKHLVVSLLFGDVKLELQ